MTENEKFHRECVEGLSVKIGDGVYDGQDVVDIAYHYYVLSYYRAARLVLCAAFVVVVAVALFLALR